jgi:hypothetical protein
MTLDPDGVADELATGDTDETNHILNAIDDLDASERYRLYDDLFDACQSVFEGSDDGYVRQSVVRVLREAYPGVERAPGGVDGLDIDEAFQTDVAAQRDRYVAVLLDALDDPDGRVRIAAAAAFNLLAVGLGMADLDDERARIAADLETLAANQPEEKRKHTEQAREALEQVVHPRVIGDDEPGHQDQHHLHREAEERPEAVVPVLEQVDWPRSGRKPRDEHDVRQEDCEHERARHPPFDELGHPESDAFDSSATTVAC